MKKKPTSAKKCKDLRRRRNPGFLEGKPVLKLEEYKKLFREKKLAPCCVSSDMVILPLTPSAATVNS